MRSIWAMVVGLGGAPAVVIRTGRASGPASGAFRMVLTTVGAALRWVTSCSRSCSQIASPRTSRRHTCVPPMAVSDHGVHQPLQWNIGNVHR